MDHPPRVSGGFASLAPRELDPIEKREAVAAIKEAKLIVGYHPNSGKTLDPDAVARVCDDVLWWHANAGGVRACLSDPIPND